MKKSSILLLVAITFQSVFILASKEDLLARRARLSALAVERQYQTKAEADAKKREQYDGALQSLAQQAKLSNNDTARAPKDQRKLGSIAVEILTTGTLPDAPVGASPFERARAFERAKKSAKKAE